MKATDQIYPPGILIKDVPATGIKARDFIAIEAMKSMLQGMHSKPVDLSMLEKIPNTISVRAYAIADGMILAST